VPALHALVPDVPPSGPLFGAVQGVVLLVFVVSGFLSVRRFRPDKRLMAARAMVIFG